MCPSVFLPTQSIIAQVSVLGKAAKNILTFRDLFIPRGGWKRIELIQKSTESDWFESEWLKLLVSLA